MIGQGRLLSGLGPGGCSLHAVGADLCGWGPRPNAVLARRLT
jgi:hypothetical protein